MLGIAKRVFEKGSNYIYGALFFSIACFFVLSLITYNYADPSYNRVTYAQVNNIAGEYGAYLADPILQLFGLSSILLIVVAFSWSFYFFYNGKVRHLILRSFSLFICLVSVSTSFAFLDVSEKWMFKSFGGVSGLLIYNYLLQYLDHRIIIAVSAILSVISFYLSAGIINNHWVFIIKSLGRVVYYSVRYLYKALQLAIRPIKNIRSVPKDYTEEKVTKIYQKAKTKTSQASKRKPLEKARVSASGYVLPSTELLNKVQREKVKREQNATYLKDSIEELSIVLSDFGINGQILGAHPGPVVTLYELEPAAGTKSSRVIGLADDISRSMKAESARIAVIPGRNALGIEMPNSVRETVFFREVVESQEYNEGKQKIPLVLGKDIAGKTEVADLTKMPHLLIAGTTGSGKSVAINIMILSILYKLPPEQCKLILIDPKMLELSVYEDIPHLLTPVVTEPGKAIVALKWVVREMENRYRLMSNLGVRNITGFNERIEQAIANGEVLERSVQIGFDRETGKPIFERVPIAKEKIPFIVVVVDEMADLMLVAGKDIETSIQRLSQMARAAGIHIIMATQRPSVDVVTGIIKANFPTRIAFQVSSKIDSRTILGEQGAEQLLGMGDMLYMAGGGKVSRVHGAFISDSEVERIVNYLKTQGEPSYIENITIDSEGGEDSGIDSFSDDGADDLYNQAVAIVAKDRKASTSYLQRKLKIGYNRAASIIEQMEENGVVGQANHVGKREILIPEA